MIIRDQHSAEDINCIRQLMADYQTSMGLDLEFQGFSTELKHLPGRYSAPDGALLSGVLDGKIRGCVALRNIESGICEMKRLYVSPEARGSRMGRRLAEEIISIAKR